MRHEQSQLRANDVFLIIFVLVAGWLLIFYSGLI